MGKVLQFKSCARNKTTGANQEYTAIGKQNTPYLTNIVETPANIVSYINSCYASDPNLSGKVTGIGYGWQKYVVPSSGKIKFSVRGGAGGSTGTGSINPVTGACSGNVNKPGRGAKLEGSFKCQRNDVLYILVGFRGWSNGGQDYGSGGGGASVILRENPSGAYTFAPNSSGINVKVDVLVVAGGGGGCMDSNFGNATYWGNDASFANGTNTNGGSASTTSGGAGLTGNGVQGSGYTTGRSLLSGTPSNTTYCYDYYGCWGGGGTSYDGGGSGAGYSGGNSRGNGAGGNGGTSYINPNLCDETFRGYATVADDSNRNLTNPWTAYGFVELELGRDENKLILVKDSDGYKWFNGADNIDGTTRTGATNQWELIPNVTTEADLTEDIYKTYGNTIINNVDGLQDNVKFLVASKEANEEIDISGRLNKVVIEQIKDMSMSDISEIVQLNIDFYTNSTERSTKFAVSKDSGKTWQTYSSGAWVDIDIHDRDIFDTQGCSVLDMSAIPLTDWNNYKAKILRFALITTTVNPTTRNKHIGNGISIKANLLGSWRHFKEDEAQYEYVSDDEIKLTFFKEGNYKVNYLDSLNPSTGTGS